MPLLSGYPTISIYVGEHDESVWRACARARVVERIIVARDHAVAGVSRCMSTERAVQSVTIGITGCLNTLTGLRGAFACLSPSGAHSDLSAGSRRSLWP